MGSGSQGNASGLRGNTSGQAKVIKCYNCQGERHMARQCTQPKRRRDATWFKEKVLLVQVRAEGKELDEEQLSFLADPGVVDGQVAQMIFQILYRSFIPNEECNGKSRVGLIFDV
ncbi:integrase, catalytic region, zinc finger, CCHC-type containing protein [Tanacetum coccineum]